MMKRLIMTSGVALALAAPLAVAGGAARAAEPSGAVTFHFEVGERQGAVMVALFDSEGAYQRSAPVQATRVVIGQGPVTAVFRGLRPGRYAAKAFHDVDDDGAMNVNMFDLPTEPYGFSNHAPARFGPPAWSQAAFDVPAAEVSQTIRLRRSER